MIINPDVANLGTSVAGAGSTSPSTARQTGNWMAELERAFLAEQPPQEEMPNQNNYPGNVANGEGQSNDALPQQSVQSQTQVQSQIQQSFASQAEATDVASTSPAQSGNSDAGKMNSASEATASSDPSATDNATKLQAAKPAPAEDKTSKVGKETQPVARSSSGKTREGVNNSPALSALPAAVAVTLAESVGAAADTALQQVRQYQTMTEMTEMTESVTATAPSSVDRALPSVQLAIQLPEPVVAQQNASGVAEEKMSDPLPESHAQADTAPSTDAYPLKQLHMFHGEQGVQAWIRDAGLSAPQAYSVAQALSSELQNSGLKLNTLVVNGKKVSSLFQGNQYPEQDQEFLSVDQ